VRRAVRDIAEAGAIIARLARSSFDVAALDIVGRPGADLLVDARLAGLPGPLPGRLVALQTEMGGDIVPVDEDARAWHDAREFAWVPPDAMLVKVPLTPSRLAQGHAAWAPGCAECRYGAGGQVAWLAWRRDLGDLDALLRNLGLSGLVVSGPAPVDTPLVGPREESAFAQRVKLAVDPDNRFGPW
jgi:hypothetical protein